MSSAPVPLTHARNVVGASAGAGAKHQSWTNWIVFLVVILLLIGLAVWMAFYFRGRKEKCKEKDKAPTAAEAAQA